VDDLIEILEAITKARGNADPEALFFDVAEMIVKRASKAFGVKNDEVAIMMLRADGGQLRFVAPRQFTNVAMIPLTNRDAIAVTTLHRRTGEAHNNVPMVRHFALFESIRIRERPLPIQKMVSVPIISNGNAIGVAQISRKGENRAAAGPDFTAAEVKKAEELFAEVAVYLERARPEKF
jgi:hypothetical protein